MVSQLKDVGEDVSDATVMVKALASLTTRFSTMQVAWDSVDPVRQTVENFHKSLIQEDTRLNSDEDALEALVATGKNRRQQEAKSAESKKTENKKQTEKYSVISVKVCDISPNSVETKENRATTVKYPATAHSSCGQVKNR